MDKVGTGEIKEIFSNKTWRPYINNDDRASDGKWPDRKREENKHHILARSNGGTNDEDNKIPLFMNYHNSLHYTLGTLYIAEKIAQILLVEQTACLDEFKADILEVLHKWKGTEPYKDATYTPNKNILQKK